MLPVIGGKAALILSVTPKSRNVSEGTMVEFYCATPDSGATLGWNTMPNVGAISLVGTLLPDGGKQSIMSFTATAQHNNTLVKCVAVKTPSANQSTALLLVQG